MKTLLTFSMQMKRENEKTNVTEKVCTGTIDISMILTILTQNPLKAKCQCTCCELGGLIAVATISY